MSDRLGRTIAAIDRLQGEDPRRESDGGGSRPAAVVYAERMTRWVERLAKRPGDALLSELPSELPSDALRIAARCQHLRRWERPRSEYPAGRAGYLAWRRDAQEHHAAIAGDLLERQGWDGAMRQRVGELLRKRRLRADPEAQALEDAACLVFLEHGLAEFASKHPRDKVVEVLRKTWWKMSEPGRAAALELPLGSEMSALVSEALASEARTSRGRAEDRRSRGESEG